MEREERGQGWEGAPAIAQVRVQEGLSSPPHSQDLCAKQTPLQGWASSMER